ncbi:MAG: hypothetical protein IKL73_02180 [Lachnospiraceae bacterium]|nr:hypothetical protein [Lachnospiraceae bacterium]
MKKRIIAFLLLMTMSIALFGCKKDKDKEETTTKAPDKAYSECATLGEYSYDIEYDFSELEVTDEELKEAIDEWLVIFGEYKVKDGMVAEDKGYIKFSLTAECEGVIMPKLEKLNKTYSINESSDLDYIVKFEKEFIGMKAGDKKEVTVTYEADFKDERVSGKTIKYNIEMVEVYELIKDEYDEDFIKKFAATYNSEITTKEKFEEELKKTIIDLANQKIMEKVMENIEASLTVKEYPAGELEYHTVRIKEEIEAAYESVKSSLEYISLSRQEFLDAVYPGCVDSRMLEYCKGEAEKYLKTKMAMVLALEREGITVTQAEIDERAKDYLTSDFPTIDKLYEYYGEYAIKQIAYDVYMEKAEKIFCEKAIGAN